MATHQHRLKMALKCSNRFPPTEIGQSGGDVRLKMEMESNELTFLSDIRLTYR